MGSSGVEVGVRETVSVLEQRGQTVGVGAVSERCSLG